MSDLDHQTAMAVGGWDPRYARILDVATLDAHGAALIDPNSDGADINVQLYRRDTDGRWHAGGSSNGSVVGDGVLATWHKPDRLELTYFESDLL